MNHKIVDFHEYCKKCLYSKTKETEEPCDACLAMPSKENSVRPLNFKPKETAKRDKSGTGKYINRRH